MWKVVQIWVKNIENSTWKIVLHCKIVFFVIYSLSSSFLSNKNCQKIWPNMSVRFPRKWNSLKLNWFQHRQSLKISIRFFRNRGSMTKFDSKPIFNTTLLCKFFWIFQGKRFNLSINLRSHPLLLFLPLLFSLFLSLRSPD